MPITIEAPTAEAALQAVQQLPQGELTRLREMLTATAPIDRSTEWSDEDLSDFSSAGAALYEEMESQESRNATSR